MICPACGGDNREGAHFCRNCGAPLGALAAPEQPGAVCLPPAAEPATLAGPAGEATAPVDLPTPEGTPQPESGAPPGESESAAAGAAPPAALPATDAAAGITGEEGAGTEAAAQSPQPAAAGQAAPPPGAEPPAEAAGSAGQEPATEPSEPLEPLPPGTVVAERYVLVGAIDSQPSEILYDARDLCRCRQCGFEGNAPDDAYCARCGASLDRKAKVRLLQVRDSQAEPQGGATVTARLSYEGLAFLLLADENPPQWAAPARQNLRLIVGQRSDVGRARELNEDSLLALTLAPIYESVVQPLLGLFAVADGMGGHEGGEVASRLALQVLAEKALANLLLPELTGPAASEQELAERLAKAVQAANDAVYLGRQKRANDMGTTLTVALVRDGSLVLAHVGDSRIYRWSADGLKQLTTDHSLIASLIAAGRATPDEIYTHPQRNVIYRSVGDRPVVDVESVLLPLAPGDRLILCSDGLWEMIRSEGIEDAMLQEADPQMACDLTVQRANAAGGEDNISVIVVQAEAM